MYFYKRTVLLKLVFLIFFILNCKTAEISKIKDWEEAQKQFINAQKLIQKSSFEYQRKNYQKAIELAEQSLKEYITFDGYYLIGSSYYQLNNFDKGLEYLLKAEKIKPNHEQLLLTLGLIYHSQLNYDQAIEKFNQLLFIRPDDPVYLYRLGLIYKDQKEYIKAIEYLEKASQNQFTYKENVLLNLGDIYFELKDYEKSQYYYEQLGKIKPEMEEVKESKSNVQIAQYLEKGNQAFKSKQYKLAEENYKKVIQLKPKEKIGYIQLGILYLEMGNFSSSIENFEAAFKISKDIETFSLLCRAYLEANQFRNFENCISKSFSLYPDHEKLLNLEALYYKKLGNYKKSISILNRVLTKNSNSITARKNLYLIFLENGNFLKAKEQLEELEKIDKENLAFWKEEKKKLESLQYLEKGEILIRNRKYANAKLEFLKALELYKHPAVYIALGDVSIKIGDLKEAEQNYIKAKNSEIFYINAYEKLLDFYKNYKKINQYNQLKNDIIKKSNQDLQMGLLYGNILIKNKEYNEALKFYSELEKKYKNDLIIQRQIALVYYYLSVEANNNQNFDLALNYLNKAIQYHPENEFYKDNLETLKDNIANKNLLPLLEKAEDLFLKEKYLEAKKEFQNIYSKWKKPLILVRLAEIEFYLGNEYEGKRLLESALKDKPKEIILQEALYTRLLELGKLEDAEKGFKEIIYNREDAYYSYYKLGIIQLLKKNYKDAISYFDDSILYSSDFLPAKVAKGIAFYNLNDISSAKELFEETSKQRGFGQELSMLNLALIYLNQNKYIEAKNEIKKLIQLFPYYADAYYHLAYIEYENRNFLEAEKLLLKAIDIQKKDVYYWGLITVYKSTGYKKEDLKKICREFLLSFPFSPFYKEVKDIYLPLKDTREYIELSYSKNFVPFNVILLDRNALFYNNKELFLVEKNSERIQYHLKYKDIIYLDINYYLWVVEKDTIRAIEFTSGNELWSKKLNSIICNVLQLKPFFVFVQSDKNCNEDQYLVYNEQKIPLNNKQVFIYQDQLFFVEKNKIFVIDQNQKFNLFLEISEDILKTYVEDSYLYLEGKEHFTIIKNNVIIKKIQKNPNSYYKFFKQNFIEFVKQKNIINKVLIHNIENHSKSELNIDLLENNPDFFYIKDSTVILFVDKQKNLNLWESSDGFKEKIKKSTFVDFKKFNEGIITLYY